MKIQHIVDGTVLWYKGGLIETFKYIFSLLKRTQSVAVVFDVGKSQKAEFVASYKKKELTQKELEKRKELFKDYALGIKLLNYIVPTFWFKGYEGDELIYNYIFAKRFHFDYNGDFCIHTIDRDLLQLVDENTKVYLMDIKKIVDLENFKRVIGFTQSDFILYKIFTGDASDNIKPIISKEEFIKYGKDKEKLFNLVLERDKLTEFLENVYLISLKVPNEVLLEYIVAKIKTWKKDLETFKIEIKEKKLDMILEICDFF